MSQEGYSNCRFYVECGGFAQAVFTEVNGLQVEMTVQEFEEGGNNGFVHRLPGRTKIGNLTLKRGMTDTNDFYKWCLEVAQGKVTRRNLSVVMYDAAGKELLRWNFVNAYPVKWIGPQFTGGQAQIAIETLELAHDGLGTG